MLKIPLQHHDLSQNEINLQVKVKIISMCITQIGNNFSTKHIHKGFVGMTYIHEDIPCIVEGNTTDSEYT